MLLPVAEKAADQDDDQDDGSVGRVAQRERQDGGGDENQHDGTGELTTQQHQDI